LDVAIGEENFEEAAVLRDELKEVRGEIDQLETTERGGDETT
jgi:protein-arginine kinase activator protein McsA